MIETSSARKYTVIKYYNDDSKKVASTKLDEAEVGVSFNTISYHNGYAYINNIGLQGHKNPQNVINLWRKTHTLACGMKATFHLINT